MNATARLVGVAPDTVSKLLVNAGTACASFHDENVRELGCQYIQCDEMWSYTYCRAPNLPEAKATPSDAGDIWTWTAIDQQSKLLVSWYVGNRGLLSAKSLMFDLRSRLAGNVQITTDGHAPYPEAVEAAFGMDVDYAQSVGVQGLARAVIGAPDMAHITTSHNERHNLTMRMSMKRYARSTNAFSKKLVNHCHNLAIYGVWYNWCRPHNALGGATTPAMAAGLADYPKDMDWMVGLSK